MKSFKLQSVLDYRILVRDLAQQELCETQKQEEAVIADMEREKEELARLYDDFEKQQQSGISPQDLKLYENQCDHKHRILEELQLRLEDVGRQIEEQHQALCNADRDKKLLEKLKEKQTLAYEQEQRKKEAIEANEIAIQAHGR